MHSWRVWSAIPMHVHKEWQLEIADPYQVLHPNSDATGQILDRVHLEGGNSPLLALGA